MPLINFIRSVEGSQDEFDVELEELGTDLEQETVDDDTSGNRSWGRLLLAALSLVSVAYAVSWLRLSSGDSSADITPADDPTGGNPTADEETGTGDDATDDEDAMVVVEHDPGTETDDAAADDETAEANETGGVNDEETDADDNDAVEVGIESPGGDEE